MEEYSDTTPAQDAISGFADNNPRLQKVLAPEKPQQHPAFSEHRAPAKLTRGWPKSLTNIHGIK